MLFQEFLLEVLITSFGRVFACMVSNLNDQRHRLNTLQKTADVESIKVIALVVLEVQ